MECQHRLAHTCLHTCFPASASSVLLFFVNMASKRGQIRSGRIAALRSTDDGDICRAGDARLNYLRLLFPKLASLGLHFRGRAGIPAEKLLIKEMMSYN